MSLTKFEILRYKAEFECKFILVYFGIELLLNSMILHILFNCSKNNINLGLLFVDYIKVQYHQKHKMLKKRLTFFYTELLVPIGKNVVLYI